LKITFCEVDKVDKVDKDDKESTIKFIEVKEENRGKGFGISLLWNFYDYIYKNQKNIRYILWDDCSDNYRLKKNIYIKIGAKYIEKSRPEMIWKIRTKDVRHDPKKNWTFNFII
jgi:hypothetical protein